MYNDNDTVLNQDDTAKEEKVFFRFKDKHATRNIDGLYHHFWYNQKTDYHTHDFYEIFVVTEGSVKHNLGGKTDFLGPGTMVLMVPGEYHQFVQSPSDKAAHFNLVISELMFKGLCANLGNDVYHTLTSSGRSLLYNMKDIEFEYFNHLSGLLLFAKARRLSALLKTIATLLISQLYNSCDNDKLYPVWLSDFLSKLNSPAYFLQPISNLYSLVPYSRSVLTNKFKHYMNETLVSYVTKQKIHYACTLLKSSDQSILDIAEATHYDSLSHFNHTFKKHIGSSPSDYRKKHIF